MSRPSHAQILPSVLSPVELLGIPTPKILALDSSKVITLSIPTDKGIKTATDNLAKSLKKSDVTAYAIADSIILRGQETNDYQRAGGLMTALISHPALSKKIKEYFVGKIPHGFKAADLNGRISIGKKDLTLLKTGEQLVKEIATKKAARRVTSDKTAAKRAEDKLKIADHDAISLELKALKATKSRVSKAKLDQTLAQNDKLKTAAIESKQAEKLAIEANQRTRTTNDKLTADAVSLKSQLEKALADLNTIQSAYSKLTIENHTLKGALSAFETVTIKKTMG